MHLFCNASRIIKMVILVDLSAIFLASPLSILVWEFSKWHGFRKLLSTFQGPNRFVALLPQSDKIFRVPHAKFIRKYTPCQISPTTCQAPENFDDPGS